MFLNSPHIDNLSKEEISRNFNFIFELFQEAVDDGTIVNASLNLIMHYFYSSVRAFTNYATENPDQFDAYVDIAFNM